MSIILTCDLKEGFEECLHTYVCMYILEIGYDLFVNAQLCVCVPFNCRERSVRVGVKGEEKCGGRESRAVWWRGGGGVKEQRRRGGGRGMGWE